MNQDKSLSAIIIDDHPMARMAIKALLEGKNINVVAEAENGNDGLKLFDTHKPDIAIIDVDLPLRSGIGIVEAVRKKSNNCIAIIISSENNYLNNKRSAEAGANAFVPKSEGLQNIIAAINAAFNGFSYFPYTLNQCIVSSSSEQMMLESLSKQEVTVMSYLLKGMDISLIANAMNISKKTVFTYKSRLLKKLGCSNLVELYAFSKSN
ncbi:response regulator [Serratia fonticola]|uniref:response regulator n=1 Tax=Serratia fonticola TaxID=47917 RepID=UPI001647E798|nr:response regulator [Serratia fonticola]MBC3252450.1 response regulator [Serratia fonticola]